MELIPVLDPVEGKSNIICHVVPVIGGLGESWEDRDNGGKTIREQLWVKLRP